MQHPLNAQLILTTHDTWLLAGDILRRDEIWFVDKDALGQFPQSCSLLYLIKSSNPRKNHYL